MRISDWSSDVCSSDLNALFLFSQIWPRLGQHWSLDLGPELADSRIDFDAFDLPDSPADRYTLAAFLAAHLSFQLAAWHEIAQWYGGRESVVEGKGVSVRVDLGGGRCIKKKKHRKIQ